MTNWAFDTVIRNGQTEVTRVCPACAREFPVALLHTEHKSVVRDFLALCQRALYGTNAFPNCDCEAHR